MAEELISRLISLRACVFCIKASVTAWLGFLIRVPSEDLLNSSYVFVRHSSATGEFMRRMRVSKSLSVSSRVM